MLNIHVKKADIEDYIEEKTIINLQSKFVKTDFQHILNG